MLLIILAIWFGYKKARNSGRNPFYWAAIAGGVFLGAQLAVGLGFGVLFGFAQEVWGWTDEKVAGYNSLLGIPAIIASVIALLLVFRYLDKVPATPVQTEPPPPPDFSDFKGQP
ncbi:MAG: hypothetical protein ABJA02_00665 [Acidobacteriota bacterium]